jgi:hypothetical protein
MSESTSAWPELPVAQWVDTRDTLQLMTQVIGKVRLADTPLMNQCRAVTWIRCGAPTSARGVGRTPLLPRRDVVRTPPITRCCR